MEYKGNVNNGKKLLCPSYFTSRRLLPPSYFIKGRLTLVKKRSSPFHLLTPSDFSKTTCGDSKTANVATQLLPASILKTCNCCKNVISTNAIDLRSRCICGEELGVDLANPPPMNYFEIFDVYLCREDDMEPSDGITFLNN